MYGISFYTNFNWLLILQCHSIDITTYNLETVLSHSSFSLAIFLFFRFSLNHKHTHTHTLANTYIKLRKNEIRWIEINWNEQMNKTLSRNQTEKNHTKFTIALMWITILCICVSLFWIVMHVCNSKLCEVHMFHFHDVWTLFVSHFIFN